MNEGWTTIYVILGILSIGYGIFLIALHIRLWQVLGYIRMACTALLSQSEYQKRRAIEMFKQGNHNIHNIAEQLKVIPKEVSEWIDSDFEIQQAEREEKKRLTIEMYKEGNTNIHDIAKQVSADYEDVWKWLKSDPEIQTDKKGAQ